VIKPAFDMQDAANPRTIIPNDTLKQATDTSHQSKFLQKDSIPEYHKFYRIDEIKMITTDTPGVCQRNSIADITFNDSHNIISDNKLITSDRFPFLFTEINNARQLAARASLLKHLKNGETRPLLPFHNDWSLLIILAVALLYSIIRTSSKNLRSEAGRFFFFRGINDPKSRDIGELFHWQSTLLNLNSFFILGLFGYFVFVWYELSPSRIYGFMVWLVSFGIIVTGITLRHYLCIIIGKLSGEQEAFKEYLLVVYQSYSFSAIILYVIIILISYTYLMPVKTCIMSGFTVLIMMYLIRIMRLLLIFINLNISIFYLILYLCALEILPVLILLKYFAGLV
jgi:hypothetical protein